MSIRQLGGVAITFANDRDAPTVDEQPQVEVDSWRLLRAPEGTLHLVTLRALSEQGGTVRVTTPITVVDQEAGIVTTSSGRRYTLMGPPEDRHIERELLLTGAIRLGMGAAVDVSVLAWDQVDIG